MPSLNTTMSIHDVISVVLKEKVKQTIEYNVNNKRREYESQEIEIICDDVKHYITLFFK